MKISFCRICLVIGLALTTVAQVTAQINSIQNAGVKNYFAANSETFATSQQADPNTIPLWEVRLVSVLIQSLVRVMFPL